ncbi:MAG: hypothetical protein II563_04460 [Treponema sp.]|nr:hypothetical protein [Treponema sp.]MBQ2552086.1 hypothetical protein [Treponema sp.]MBQ5384134.1 hypothetical protein [Treponema sp.]
MKIMKFFTALILASVFLISPAAAKKAAGENDSNAETVESEESEGLLDTIINAGKSAWNAVKDKTIEIVDDIGGAINSLTTQIPVGTWEFKNGKYSTTIICEKDGSMTITQTDSLGSATYTGKYTSTVNKITFKPEKKSTKVLFVTTSKKMDETWEIEYSMNFSKEIKITSSQIPNDANGYSFANATIFTAVKADAK